MATPQPIVVRSGTPACKALWPLHDVASSRRAEAEAASQLPPHTLMRRAGVAVGQLALALAPHAQRVWVLAGPGNNGGDGLEAATLLRQAGKRVSVSLLASKHPPGDAAAALLRARAAGVSIHDGPLPPETLRGDDLAIDALFGIGITSAPRAESARGIAALNAGVAPVLAIDLPSGLDADRGCTTGAAARARWTLSLLTLKPGLVTADGRDHAGDIWFDDLGVRADPGTAVASLMTGTPAPWPTRLHASHKGSHGDLWVVGGAPGMAGAARLAARAASVAGAGRVHLVLLDAGLAQIDGLRPELMHRPPASLHDRDVNLEASVVVCGCGGGQPVRELLPPLVARAGRLLLDADALNALASDAALAQQLSLRAARGRPTVLTPHPLEAARLLGTDKASVQADRLAAAREIAARFQATVLLKGSGSVVATPGAPPTINASGNGSLATAGTGDVLAGWIGGLWAQGLDAVSAAGLGTYSHGHVADSWLSEGRGGAPLVASLLIDRLAALRR